MSDETRRRLLEAARARPGPETLEAALRAWARSGEALALLERVGDAALGADPLATLSRGLWAQGLGLGDPRFAHGPAEDWLLGGGEAGWLATVDAAGVLRRYALGQGCLLDEDHLPAGTTGLLRRGEGVLAVVFVAGEPGPVVVEVADLGGEVPASSAVVRGLPAEVAPDGSGAGWVARGPGGALVLVSQLVLRELPTGRHSLGLPSWTPPTGATIGQVWLDPAGRRVLVEPLHEMEPRAQLVALASGEVEARLPGVVAAAFDPAGAALALVRCRYVSAGERWDVREQYSLEVLDLAGGGTRWEVELDDLPAVSLDPAAWGREVRWAGGDVRVDGVAYGGASGARRKMHAPPPGRRVDTARGTLWVRVTRPGSREDEPGTEPVFGPRGHTTPVVRLLAPAGGGEAWTQDEDEVFRAWSWADGAPRRALAACEDRLVLARGGRFGALVPGSGRAEWTVLALPDGPVVGMLAPDIAGEDVVAVDLSADGARLVVALEDGSVEVLAVAPVEADGGRREVGNLLDQWRRQGAAAVAWDGPGRAALVLEPLAGKASWRDTDGYEIHELALPGRGPEAAWVHDPAGPGVLVGVPGHPLVRLVPGAAPEVVVPAPVGRAGFRVAPDGAAIGVFERGGGLGLWRPGEARAFARLTDLEGAPGGYALGPGGVVLRVRGAGVVSATA